MATAMNVSAWSMTAASNDGADSTIGTVADGSAPNTVDNWTRGVMAAVRRYADDVGGAPAAVGGTANAITITTNRAISSAHQAAGFSIRFKAAGTNNDTVTVAVDGLSAQPLERVDGSALSPGDIVSGGIYDIAFNTTNSGYTLMTGLNPTGYATYAGTTSFTATQTITKTSAGAATTGLSLINSSNTAGTEIIIDLSPNTAGAGVRSAQITSSNQGGVNEADLRFKTNFAAAPTLVGRFGSYNGSTKGGFVVGSASVDDKGFGTINAVTLYQDGGAVYSVGGTDVAVTDGGTGGSTAEAARSGLGVKNASDSFFRAHKTSTQGITANTTTTVTWVETTDVGALFASNTWTPPAGSVSIECGIEIRNDSVNDGVVRVCILKNGATASPSQCGSISVPAGEETFISVGLKDVANGTDTYIVSVRSTEACTIRAVEPILDAIDVSWFQGCMIGS